MQKPKLDYHILSTGSSGNAVRIGEVMVDCGIPFPKMKDELYKCKVLLITHIHGDHVNKRTLGKIRTMFPRMFIVANYEVAQKFPDCIDYICNAGFEFPTKVGTITPFECHHDVVTYGYTWKVDGNQILYATDTSSMADAPADIQVDYCFLEANYDEEKLRLIVERENFKTKYGYDVRNGCYRHLSVQACKGFFYSHRASADSELIQLHMSSRFY